MKLIGAPTMNPANLVFRIARWVVAGAAAMTCAFALAQPRYGLSPEAQAVFDRWVLATCIGGEDALVDELRRYREPLAAAFRKAIVDGPSPEELKVTRAAAEERFAARATFPIEDFTVEGVSRQDLARFRRVSRQSYVDDQVRRFATGYRANAVAGLGIVAGPESRAILARMAANANDPLALAAREALKAADRR
jgi:hypothetical protein